MAQDKVSQRYAKAIFEYVKDATKVRALMDELKAFLILLEGNQPLTLVLTSDVYSEAERNAVIEDLAKKGPLSEDARKILLVLSTAKRLDHLKSILDRLHFVMLESASVVPLMVETATHLESEEKRKIEQKFESILGKKVEANYQVDANLIGGLKATAAGRTYDGTLMGWFTTFEESLISG